MQFSPGTRLGPYEIVAPIGAGGMGQVFKARDTRLDRSVAIKVLPEEFADDAQLKIRFEREARTISQLNHPHICTLHDVGHENGTSYLVMELVQGENLADRLERGPLPLADTFRYAAQIADALDRAHRSGIVHRDLKPGNVMITKAGAKLLDFGLARPRTTAGNDADAPTAHQPITAEGTLVGTLPYMAPEQLEGREADPRTDIFAFGALMYEMVTGRRAFSAPSAASLAAKIIEHQPPKPSELQPITPPALERVIMTCLEKDPDARYQCAADLTRDLRWIDGAREAPSQPAAAGTPLPKRWFYAAALLLVAIVAAAALLAYRAGTRSGEALPAQFRQLTFDRGEETHPSIAPDGKMFAFVKAVGGQRDIFLQRVDGRSAINLTADNPGDDSQPLFSPDGGQIAFRSDRDGGGIFLMGATGESVRRLTDSGFDPSWSPDGKEIIYASEEAVTPRIRYGVKGLHVADVATGTTRVFYAGDAMQPRWSPNHRRVAFWATDQGGRRDIYTIDRDGKPESLVAVTADSAIDWNPVWSPDGNHLYFSSERDGTMNLWRIAIDETSGQPAGEAEPVRAPAAELGFISVSRDGEQLLYQSASSTGELLAMELDPSTERLTAHETPVFSGSLPIRHVAPSPDGKSIAFTSSGAQEDLFVMAADGSGLRQLTDDLARERGVSWSPDGSRILFYSNRDATWYAYSIRPDGSGTTQLTAGEEDANWPRLSHDGRRLAYVSDQGARVADASGGLPITDAAPLPDTPRGEFEAVSWSPDGQWLAGNPWGTHGSGLFVYSFADRTLHDLGARAITSAFLDNRRIAFVDDRDRVGIADIASREVRFIGTLPGSSDKGSIATETVAFSIDGRYVLIYRMRMESDIWQMSLSRSAP